jgi:integrase
MSSEQRNDLEPHARAAQGIGESARSQARKECDRGHLLKRLFTRSVVGQSRMRRSTAKCSTWVKHTTSERNDVGSGPKIPRLEQRVREGFYERAEFETIVAYLPEDLQDFARWGYFTGWRKSEIASLRWNELNMENRQLRLRGQFSRTVNLGWSRSLASSGK